MSFGIEAYRAQCPWCGEPVDLLLDCSLGAQEYVEDCAVCCHPMLVRIDMEVSGDGSFNVSVRRENE
jgi:hypothetical protein